MPSGSPIIRMVSLPTKYNLLMDVLELRLILPTHLDGENLDMPRGKKNG
jgi:hypothetical protein